MREHLVLRLAAHTAVIDGMFDAGEIVGSDGTPSPGHPLHPRPLRLVPPRHARGTPVPFPLHVVHQDDHLVVADKPHFLATTPRGSHVRQTALARLRHDLGLPELTAAHRLDRLTAGLVLFTVRPEERGAYQTLFRDRRVRKEYEAVAAYDPDLGPPAPCAAGS